MESVALGCIGLAFFSSLTAVRAKMESVAGELFNYNPRPLDK